ncbi:MAG: hypothetical protein AVDCRST_MAG49-2725 [uncultured Thermomicrobiales bacterium]|uniref:Cupin 2 conserved barrel domain-containing protein n=1 Tax=uncultured Thermomicrobiales bacterium TaxID=1645740 RepID=A0A6J4V0Y8_9BACT|nr:MAG: hypothetical protein AVDCRST_MAG49-2725 [uncultured Thermomicrobiales bacterium]
MAGRSRVALLGFLVASSPAALAITQDGPPAAALVIAQDGTPSAEGVFDLEGVGFEPLAVTSGVGVPSPADLVLVRLTLEPGAVLPADPNDPSLAMVFVEAGELTLAPDGAVTVTRAGALGPARATAEAGGPFVAPEETAAAGATLTLREGDVAFVPANSNAEIRNEGEKPVVLLVFLVAPPNGDEAVPAEGTPEGTPVVGTPTS